MRNLVVDSMKTYLSRFYVLHLAFLLAFMILIFGSWILFVFGGILLLPIFSGVSYIALSSARNRRIGIKDIFIYLKRNHRKQAIVHYILIFNMYVISFGAFFLFYQLIERLLPETLADNTYIAIGIVLISVLPYIFLQTYFSMTSYIRLDNETTTPDSVKRSIAAVKPNILKYTALRSLFFFRNIGFFVIIAMRLVYHFGLSETPYQLSGQPAMFMFFSWFIILVLTSPFYEVLMAHMYLRSTVESDFD